MHLFPLSTLKTLIVCSFLAVSSLGKSQIFLKATAFLIPPLIETPAYFGYSAGIEFKKNYIGVDYNHKNATLYQYGLGNNIKRHQISLKYFLIKCDTSTSYDLFIAPTFFYQRTRRTQEVLTYAGIGYATEFYLTTIYEGFGYGVLLGGMKFLNKDLGIEPGVSFSCYSINNAPFFMKSNQFHVGLRIIFTGKLCNINRFINY